MAVIVALAVGGGFEYMSTIESNAETVIYQRERLQNSLLLLVVSVCECMCVCLEYGYLAVHVCVYIGTGSQPTERHTEMLLASDEFEQEISRQLVAQV